ncbi:DMT family transporter [Agrobacterium rosae]|uniref:DMT family transporter n=1 Tax=Agrobacterium rosae TaxID=1972867 RepID=A0AAW9FSI8_9HYPH|nr:DMT family transporter [Agrobacterium rosae]MDX8305763.1 DMT family transporter [Agrobacterium rosae]
MATSQKRVGRLTASLIGAVGVVLWATETMLVTLTTSIPPLQTVALAFMFSAAMSPAVWFLTGSHPFEAFRQPLRVWLFTVGSLVGYHSCIYYATQQAPPAAAALLQSTTPLMIVIGSAFLPGERLRWWHVVGALLGFVGVTLLVETGGDASAGSSIFYLALIGVAAGLWGLYSVVARTLPDVPSSALGMFYAACAVFTFAAHLLLETWVPPQPTEWLAVAGLGIFPMGLAIYFWDFGLKRGDIQALGAFSYVEPFIGAVLVALFTGATLSLSLFWSGLLVVTGAVIASAGLWRKAQATHPTVAPSSLPNNWLASVNDIRSQAELHHLTNRVIERLLSIGRDYDHPRAYDQEMSELLLAFGFIVQIWDELQSERGDNAEPRPACQLVA